MGGAVDWHASAQSFVYEEDRSTAPPTGTLNISMDLAAGAVRQRSFIEKVAPLFDASSVHVRTFVAQYRKFLSLMKSNPGVSLVRWYTMCAGGKILIAYRSDSNDRD
jgi:hypothetical protein